jgi:hypothetical protein
MAGSPLKRQRKAVRNEDGTVIAFPRMPHVAELPKLRAMVASPAAD